MKINGEGIYHSKPLAPYSIDQVFFTQSDDEKKRYVFYLSDKADVSLASEIKIPNFPIRRKSSITLLGHPEKLRWKSDSNNLIISIPSSLQNQQIDQYAAVFKISQE